MPESTFAHLSITGTLVTRIFASFTYLPMEASIVLRKSDLIYDSKLLWRHARLGGFKGRGLFK